MLDSAVCPVDVHCLVQQTGRGGCFCGCQPCQGSRVLPLSFPKFAHQREAATCSVHCHAPRGPSHDAWALWGLVGCVGVVPTLPCTASPKPRHLDGMANRGWLGLIHSTSCPAWEEPRESTVLPQWLIFGLINGRMLLVFRFLT